MKLLRSACAALALSLLLTACAAQSQAHTETLPAMDTVMTLTAYGPQGPSALADAQDLIRELEGLLSATRPDSQIYALNQGRTVALDPQVRDLLERGLALCAQTGGALDLTIYPVVRAWGFTTGNYRVPSEPELRQLLERVDYTQVQLPTGNLTLPQGMELDLGAVAKGYTGDRLAQLLRQQGVDHALLDLGGNIHTVGTRPDGALWRVGIRNPEGEGYLAVVEVADQAVVTSGMYERYFQQDGVRYGHIIDPATGRPADTGLASVSIVSSSGTLADALSTALFVMGRERAVELWRSRSDFEFIFIGQDGSVTISQGLAGRFSFHSSQDSRSLEVVRR